MFKYMLCENGSQEATMSVIRELVIVVPHTIGRLKLFFLENKFIKLQKNKLIKNILRFFCSSLFAKYYITNLIFEFLFHFSL